MTYPDALPTAVKWAAALAPAAARLAPLRGLLTGHPVHAFAAPDAPGTLLVAGTPDDCKRAAEALADAWPLADWRPGRVTPAELADPRFRGVKLAHSRTVRALTDAFQLTDGQAAGGSGLPPLPGGPHPLASAVAGALLLGGGGYALGRLARAVLPDGVGDHLPRTGLVAGAALGAVPAGLWAAARAAAPADPDAPTDSGTPGEPGGDTPGDLGRWVDANARFLRRPRVKPAAETAAGAWSPLPGLAAAVTGVYVPGLERLFRAPGADPRDAALVAGGVLAAARQAPTRAAPAGYVPAESFGSLALHAGGDYARGLVVGAALNKLVGTPYAPPAFGSLAAGLGLAARLIPPLFGR